MFGMPKVFKSDCSRLWQYYFYKIDKAEMCNMLSLAAFFTKSEGVFPWDNLDQDWIKIS